MEQEQFYCRACHRQRPADHFLQPGHFTSADISISSSPARPRASKPAAAQEGEGSAGAWWQGVFPLLKLGAVLAGAALLIKATAWHHQQTSH